MCERVCYDHPEFLFCNFVLKNFFLKNFIFISFSLSLYIYRRLGTRKNYAKHYLQINATTFKQRCPQLDFLSPLQQELCSLHPNVLHTISRGARFGIEECQYQFKMNRWNCSAMDSADSVFGPIIDISKFLSWVLLSFEFYLKFCFALFVLAVRLFR